MQKLTPVQFESVQHLLADAYRLPSLTQLVRNKLGKTLADLVSVNNDFKSVVFDLLDYSEQAGLTRALLEAVLADPERQGRRDIQDALSQILRQDDTIRPKTQPPPQPHPQSPQSYDARVREVFGNQYDMLEAILEKNAELKVFLLKNYGINEAVDEAPLAKLLVAFHHDFGSAIQLFTRAFNDKLVDAPGAADLLGGTIFLSMCPESATRLSDPPGNILEVNHLAKRGIAEMLVCWVRSNGRERPKLENLTGEANPGSFESTPQMAVAQIRANLMARMAIDPNALDAAEQLDDELDFRKGIHQPVFVAITDGDGKLIEQLSALKEFRHAILLVVSDKASINPGQHAKDARYDGRFESFLQKMLTRIKI